MTNLAKFFLDNYKFTAVLTLGLVIFGIFGFSTMNAESFPSVSMATATVITSYDGASAEDIETKITKPLEDEIRSISGLKDVRSISQSGLSTIVIRADMDNSKVDVDEVMGDVQRAIDRVNDLPSDLQERPTFTEIKSEEFPVLELAITGTNENRSRDKISDLLKEEIEDLNSIKNVRLTGFKKRAFQIMIDSKKLDQFHISIDEVLNSIHSRNINTPGGELKEEISQKLVRLEGKIKNSEELENIVIRANFSAKPIFLKDVATVLDSEEEIKTLTKYNNQKATLLTVTKKAGSDTIKMVTQIEKKIERFKETYPDYQFIIFNSEGIKVKNRVEVLNNNAFSGLILVIVFLFFFLPGKVGLAAGLSLPLAVLGTLGFMPSFGMNIDTITVLALVIALGMLVDNAVVISENYTRLRYEGADSKMAALESVKQLWLPITMTALTTIAAFLPMLVTKGVMGEFIKWIPIVVTISLLLSLLEGFFFLPMRLRFAGKNITKSNNDGHSDWFSKFEGKFERFMKFIISRKYLVSLVFSGVILFSFFMMIFANKFILFPAEQTEIYIARAELPKGTRLEHTYSQIELLSKKVKDSLKDDVKHIVGRAGVSRTDFTDPKAKEGNNVAMLTIFVSDNAKYNVSHTEILKKLREIKIDGFSSISFEALINGPPVGNPIEATFRSNSEKDLNNAIKHIREKLNAVDGIYDLKTDEVTGDDEVYIKVDYNKASQLGINLVSLGRTIRAAVSGNRVANVTLENKDIDLIVRLEESQRKNVTDLLNIKILDQSGNLIPLRNFSTVNIESGPPQIKRFDFKRSKTLTGNINEEKITSIEANQLLQKEFEKIAKDFQSVSLVFGGAAENTKESMESLFQALILSLIGIFAILVFLFNSFVKPGIIMTTIPLGLLGLSVAFYFHQRPLSFLALIGVIGLAGIIVNSGIVLISFIDQMKEEGKLSLEEILVKASGKRLRAVVVTSLTTISGLLPTAYGIGGSDAILIPMTMAMAWGLTSGTVLTLVWVPCAYAITEDITGFFERKFLK